MGALSTGYRAGLAGREQARQARQDELTRLQQNMELNQQTGAVQYNEQGQTQKDLELEAIKAQLEAVKASNASMESQQSADAITSTIENVIGGDWHNAKQNYNKVKAKLGKQKTLDVTDINPVNFSDPQQLQQLAKLGVDTKMVTDGRIDGDGMITSRELQDALQRSFITITGHDGTQRVSPVDGIVKATNTWNLMNTQQRDAYTQNAQRVNGILKGTGILSAQEDIQGLQLEQQKNMMAELKQARDSGDLKAIQAVIDKYDTTASVKYKPSDAKAQFELQGMQRKQAINDYVNTKPAEFMTSLDAEGNTISVNGVEVPKMEVAKAVQGENKLGMEQLKFMDGMYATIKNTTKLRNKLEKSSFDWNAAAKAMAEVQAITGTDWMKLSAKEQKDLTDRFGFDSELKTVMAGYIKAMSGAAVSDQERGFYQDAILKGNWANKDAAKASMEGFITGVKNGYDAQLESVKSSLPATYLEKKALMDNLPGIEKPKPKYTPEQIAAARAELARRRGNQ